MAAPKSRAILLCGVVLASICCIAQQQSQPPMQAPASHSQPSIYQQWLDEDVRWIIAPKEKVAFLKMENDAERDDFVKQFWLRRDPTPNTAENEFKEEHYRRIAYSNIHFASTTRGSLSDRGRTYIVNGPADTIKSDGSTEVWHYRNFMGHRDVDLKFVDECNCNDHKLRSPKTK